MSLCRNAQISAGLLTNNPRRDESEHLDEEDERLFLREQVEILVRATKQAMKDASSPTLTCRDVGTQTGNPRPLSYTTNSADASPTNTEQPYPGASEEPYCSKERHSTRIERFRHVPEEDNTARWLYRIVFGEVATTPCLNYGDDDGGLHMQSVPPVRRLASECSKISGTEVMDSLLRSWSRLNEDEIQELRTLPCSASADEKNATATTIRIHGHSHSLMRASVHQMVSKALSYAHPNDTNESAHDGGKSDAQLSSRRRTSQDGSSDLVMHAAHSPNEADPKNFGEDERHGETPQNRESSRSSGLPPLPPPQHTSRHRHRPASWVLGPHRAQNRSSERREGHAAPSSLSSRSRFIGWRSQQARRPPEKPGVGLSSPTSSSSLSSSTSDGDKCARLPSRSSQQSPLPKVLFTSPVARLGSASSCTTGNTNNTTATATTATTKATTTTTRRHSSPAQPTKGILKTPTHHFPEEPNPIREGVAPHKFDKSKSDAPPGAKWTKIKRSWVNPEALTIGKERFEVVGNHYVKVLRVLSREEIEAYRIATAQLRAMREGGPPGGGGA